jgi:hypothetical protein
MRHQPLLAKTAFFTFLIGAVIALAACICTRLHLVSLDLGLKLVLPGLAIGLIGLGCGGAWIWRALALNNSQGWRLGTIGLIGSLLLVGIPASYQWRVETLPPIHDVSTDIGDAPQFVALLAQRKGATNPASYDGPNVIVYQGEKMTTALAQKNAWQDIKPLERLAGTIPQHEFISRYFWRALNAVNGLGWRVAAFDVKSGRIEATSQTLWFGGISDIVIRVKPAGKIGVRVDVRAKSRHGDADGGRNAELVHAFLAREDGH